MNGAPSRYETLDESPTLGLHGGRENIAVYQYPLGAAERIGASMGRSSTETWLYCIGSDLLLSYMGITW